MNRAIIDLNGRWKFKKEQDRKGLDRKYFSPDDIDRWRNAEIPCVFENLGDDLFGYEGIVWFLRTFAIEYPPEKNERVYIEFECVNIFTRLYINGAYAGENAVSHLPFEFDITGFVVNGKNDIAVMVDNYSPPGNVPNAFYWRNHGGITGKVRISIRPETFIHDVKVLFAEPVEDSCCFRTAITIRCFAPVDTNREITLSIVEQNNRCVYSTRKPVTVKSNAETHLVVEDSIHNGKLWSPETPYLYKMAVEIQEDSFERKFGFRKIRTCDGKIFLNDEEIFLQGFNRHQDISGKGCVIVEEQVTADYKKIKNTGANFVRMCHYPHHSYEIDLCDEIGLLVMCELPVCGDIGVHKEIDKLRRKDVKDSSVFDRAYKSSMDMLERLISRDISHPSVMFWSMSNETAEDNPSIREINDKLIRKAKQMDSTRFCTHVSAPNYWYDKKNGRYIDAALNYQYDDVICVNCYHLFELRKYRKIYDLDYIKEAREFWPRETARMAKLFPGKAMVITEFGYQHGLEIDAEKADFYQSEYVRAEFENLRYHVSGAAYWVYADHDWPRASVSKANSELMPVEISPWGAHTKQRKEKKIYGLLKKLYTGKVEEPLK